MQTGFLHLHKLLPYFILLLPLLAIVVSLVKEKNETVSGKPSKLVLLVMNIMSNSNIMKTPELRKKLVEHPAMMILAVVFITIGYSKAKRATNGRDRAKKIAIFYGLGLLISIVAMSYMGYWSKMAFMH